MKPVTEAFQGKIPRVRVSLLYTLGLFLVASAMLLLPFIYLGLIGLVIYFIFWWAKVGMAVWEVLKLAQVFVLFYLGPIVVGALMVVFMVKPFLVRSVEGLRPIRVQRQAEPLLFAFVERLCQVVGAPMPAEVLLDTQVNASAGFRRGLLSLFSNDLGLTIGLPLAAGLNLHQFAGVLAHEFGHFGQAAGMRLNYIIRSINRWFERVVYGEDIWDERIRHWSREWDSHFVLVLLVARFFISLTRKILRLLMLLGRVLSSFMSRHMEYDADRYEVSLMGAEVFESTTRRFAMLSVAHDLSLQDLGHAWDEGRLVDNFPALVLTNESRIPPDTKQKAIRALLRDSQTDLFNTHPSNADRIAKAKALKGGSLFKLDTANPAVRQWLKNPKEDPDSPFSASPPASILFRDFGDIARRVSLNYYRAVLGPQVSAKNLVSVETIVKGKDEESEYSEALGRFCLGKFSLVRPFFFSKAPVHPSGDPEKTLGALKEARQSIVSARAKYSKVLERFLDLENRTIHAFQVQALIDAGIYLPSDNLDAMNVTFQALEQGKRIPLVEELSAFEQILGARIASALQLLAAPLTGQGIKNAESLGATMNEFLYAANALETKLETMRDLNIAYWQLATLVDQPGKREDEKTLLHHIRMKSKAVRDELGRLGGQLEYIPYPFEHTQAGITLADFIVGRIPKNEETALILGAASDSMSRFLRVYERLCARLVFTAEMVEQSLGLPALLYDAGDKHAPAQESPSEGQPQEAIVSMSKLIHETRTRLGKPKRSFSQDEQIYNAIQPAEWIKKGQGGGLAEIYTHRDLLLSYGTAVWGYVVQANALIFETGPDDCPAAIVYSMDKFFDEKFDRLEKIARRLYALKGEKPSDKETASFARVITDERTFVFNRQLPKSLTGGRAVFFTTLIIQRKHLPLDYLAAGWFPVLTSPRETIATMVVPSKYWPPSLVDLWTGNGTSVSY